MSATLMAKKTATPKRRPKNVGESKRKDMVLALKGSPEWKDWVDALAEHCRTDLSKLVDRALVDLAKSEGFDPKPPQR